MPSSHLCGACIGSYTVDMPDSPPSSHTHSKSCKQGRHTHCRQQTAPFLPPKSQYHPHISGIFARSNHGQTWTAMTNNIMRLTTGDADNRNEKKIVTWLVWLYSHHSEVKNKYYLVKDYKSTRTTKTTKNPQERSFKARNKYWE